jgi:hypothetical protein
VTQREDEHNPPGHFTVSPTGDRPTEAFCEHCGRPLDEDVHARCALDPRRFCKTCGRRLKVQVFPDRYDARCLVCDA